MTPLAIDMFCGVGGWTDGLLAEGWDCIGFDIERHWYDGHCYPAQLVLQDIRTLHGYQLRSASLIVASPPCQFFSYTAMPWKRAKALAAAVRADPERLEAELALFNACFRIQREASEAAGRKIPLIVENVRGAQEWIGRSRWNFGSYHLWGDVPALMPKASAARKNDGGSWFRVSNNTTSGVHNPVDGFKFRGLDWRPDNPGQDFTRLAGKQATITEGVKVPGVDWHNYGKPGYSKPSFRDGVKHEGSGPEWFDTGPASMSSSSSARKQASAMIAKIPPTLAQYIGRVFRP